MTEVGESDSKVWNGKLRCNATFACFGCCKAQHGSLATPDPRQVHLNTLSTPQCRVQAPMPWQPGEGERRRGMAGTCQNPKQFSPLVLLIELDNERCIAQATLLRID